MKHKLTLELNSEYAVFHTQQIVKQTICQSLKQTSALCIA